MGQMRLSLGRARQIDPAAVLVPERGQQRRTAEKLKPKQVQLVAVGVVQVLAQRDRTHPRWALQAWKVPVQARARALVDR
jgi:hypothetical protein